MKNLIQDRMDKISTSLFMSLKCFLFIHSFHTLCVIFELFTTESFIVVFVFTMGMNTLESVQGCGTSHEIDTIE